MKVKVQKIDGKASGDIELNDDVFGVEPRALARSGVGRRAAARLVMAIAALRSSSVAVRLTVRASVTSSSR